MDAVSVKERCEASTGPGAKRVWGGERFGDFLAAIASVLAFGGAYLLFSEVALPMMSRGFAAM